MNERDWLRARACTNKVRYGLLEFAEQAARRTPKKGHRRASAYACSYCGGFHVGHDFSARQKKNQGGKTNARWVRKPDR